MFDMMGSLDWCQHTGLPWRDLQADWNSRVRSRHVILPKDEDHKPAEDHNPPGELCAVVWLERRSSRPG